MPTTLEVDFHMKIFMEDIFVIKLLAIELKTQVEVKVSFAMVVCSGGEPPNVGEVFWYFGHDKLNSYLTIQVLRPDVAQV